MGRAWIWLVVPALLLAAVVAFLLYGQPLRELTAAAPPVEELSVEAVRLEPGLIALTLRADGSAPLTLAQVQVDGAWRAFTHHARRADRPARTPRGSTSRTLGSRARRTTCCS